MRCVALALVVCLGGCSFFMAEKRLKEPPAEGERPKCDTNAVVPLVDLLLGISGAAIGFGTALGDGTGGERAAQAFVGVIGVGFIAGWWYGRKWHNECEEAKREFERR